MALKTANLELYIYTGTEGNYVSTDLKYQLQKSIVGQNTKILFEISELIRDYLSQGKTIVDPSLETSTQAEQSEKMPLAPIEEEIVSILDEYVKPAVASDGGNIAFEHYDADQKIVHVLLQGACSGCPSSTFTLKNGIENILKEMLPEKVNAVEAING